jgi:tRNA(Ile)-lysidine synthase
MMKRIYLSSGCYIIAVSGGVDSVVLLDILRRQTNLELIVAHFDHGIRSDSRQDRLLVEKLAKHYGLTFVYGEAELGPNASEESARHARYEFLRSSMLKYHAKAIVTAHHQDDSIETALINLLRGTNRRGLSSLRSTKTIKRPLLATTKTELIEYALNHNLSWREDITNRDEKYLRNKIRYQLSLATEKDKKRFLALIQAETIVNDDIDKIITDLLSHQTQPKGLARQWFIELPHIVSKEVLARWLSLNGVSNINRKRIEQLAANLKTASPGKKLDVNNGSKIVIHKDYLALETLDR